MGSERGNDPNDDPELVSMFTITESDEDSDSDEDSIPPGKSISLQPTENPYDRPTKVQQANRELFSQPFAKKKPKTMVQFDLNPQNINANASMSDGGEGESVYMDGSGSNVQSRSQRKDTAKVVVMPRRFSSMQPNTNIYRNHHDSFIPKTNQIQCQMPRLVRQQDTRGDSQTNIDHSHHRDERQSSSEYNLSQIQSQNATTKSQTLKDSPRPLPKQADELSPRSSTKDQNMHKDS